MADVHNTETRRFNMSRVRGRHTRPEITLRRLVFSLGYRYRLHDSRLPGKPDLVFAGRRKVIFMHGCFWHCHDCAKGKSTPARNEQFWKDKRAANVARDARTIESLSTAGWATLVVWECQLRDVEALTHRLVRFVGVRSHRK